MRNWAGNIEFSGSRIHRPSTVDELRRVVAAAPRVRVLGAGHSFSAVLDPVADLVRLDRLRQPIEIDPASGTATIGAATRYADLCPVLDRAGLALSNLASLPDITVAGACLTGTHGSGNDRCGLASAVRGLEMVGPEGDLVELRRDADGDMFAGAVVSLGALGVVTRLTLALEPAFQMRQTVRVGVPLDQLAARFDAVFGAASSVSAFTLWGEDAELWVKRRQDRPDAVPELGRPASEPVHPVPGCDPASCTDQTARPGPWHERLPHFRVGGTPSAGRELQSEYFLPRAAAAASIAVLRGMRPALEPVLRVSEIRTTRADDLWLSPSYGQDSVTVHFAWIDDAARVWPVIRAVEERLGPLGIRPHWSKLTAISEPRLRGRYPRAAEFRDLMSQLDPGGKFRNSFLDAVFRDAGAAPAHIAEEMTA
jgi:alditol oxidase